MVAGQAGQPAGSQGQGKSGLNQSTLSAALSGDASAFEALTEQYRRELFTHCYRMVGSLEDAEDLVQETLLRAWRRLSTYEGRATFRAWLYKIATNACLDALDRRPRRGLPQTRVPSADPRTPIPAPLSEPVWLEPFPDEFLEPTESTPEARIEAREGISLSFLVALQTLPPRQRCVLILSDVLDWHAAELAEMLGISLPSVNSLLHRARLSLRKTYPAHLRDTVASTAEDRPTRFLLERYVKAWESADVDGIIALLTEETTFAMPPLPFWLRGRTAIRDFIATSLLGGEPRLDWCLLPIRANGEHGFAWYSRGEADLNFQPYTIQVMSTGNGGVKEIISFLDRSLFRFFDLPTELPG